MRDTEFRLYSKHFGKMEYFDFSDIVQDGQIYSKDLCRFDLSTINIPIMRNTTLKDENEISIFEGDKLKNKGIYVGVVKMGKYILKDWSKHDRQKNHIGWHVEDDKNNIESLEYLFWNLTANYSITRENNWVEVIGNEYEGIK